MKILMVYHSGVGNTKLIAEMLHLRLQKEYEIEMYTVEEIGNQNSYIDYDGYIIGFPTYHTHPSISITKFINKIESQKNSKPAYIFTTCGWYSANTLRIFAKMCIAKNIMPVLSRSYRCTATDGVLLAPYIKSFWTFEKRLDKKIEKDVERIKDTFTLNPRAKLPRFSLISILNYPNKKLGQAMTFNIYLHNDCCIKCGKCIKNCNANALVASKDNYPIFIKSKCEKCYRCIHHCPSNALSLSKNKVPKKLLTREFFDSYK